MLIIFGSPRSGTTLLASTLNKHSRISIQRESDFLVPAAYLIHRISDEKIGRVLLQAMIPNTRYFPTSLGQYLSAEDISGIVERSPYQFADLAVALYAEKARRAGKIIGGDKSPNDLMSIQILDRMALLAHPDVRVIHLVRDVRDVMLSLRMMNWAQPGTEDYFPRIWCNSNLHLQCIMQKHASRYYLLRYEDLVRAPQEQLQEICQFLNVEFEPEILDSNDRNIGYEQMEDHANLSQPFLSDRAFAWKKKIDDVLRRQCDEQAGEALRRFNYEFERELDLVIDTPTDENTMMPNHVAPHIKSAAS
ncbi:MAG TPA: sulfotransferase [Tepidisphaeraceae bacterium]|jgi:hypothetical protein|nr:sulfotransferase [Tepidisphaeraceae bacterium]